jgi:hypothetical protein
MVPDVVIYISYVIKISPAVLKQKYADTQTDVHDHAHRLLYDGETFTVS